jgi:hypothetical protein
MYLIDNTSPPPLPCYGSGIWCLFDPWIRDPGWVKKSGSGMNNSDHISESLETIFWVTILKFLDVDGWKKIRSGMEKILIRDKHPGSATLPLSPMQ